jgi:hypothetical protein
MRKNPFLLLLVISLIVASIVSLIIHGLFYPQVLVPGWLLPWIGFGVLRSILETFGGILLWVVLIRFGIMPVILGESKSFQLGDVFEPGSVPDFPQVIGTGTGFVLLFATLTFVLHPIAVDQQELSLFRSRFSRDQISRAEELERRGNLFEAMAAADAAFFNSPTFQDAVRTRQRIQRAVAALPVESVSTEELIRRTLPLNLTFDDLLGRAQQSLAREDFFSAVFFADLALQLSGRQRDPRALAIRQEGRRRIQVVEMSEAQAQQSRRFFDKRMALDALEQGNLVESYYIMKSVHDQNPQDADVIEWFPVIQQALANTYFFLDEATEALEFGTLGSAVAWQTIAPGGEQILVFSASQTSRLRVSIPPGSRLFLEDTDSGGSSTRRSNILLNYFLFGVELAVINRDSGALEARGTIPYAKAMLLQDPQARIAPGTERGVAATIPQITGWFLQTQGISRDGPGAFQQIQWDLIEPNRETFIASLFEERDLIPLPMEPELLFAVGSFATSLEGLNLAQVFNSLNLAGQIGYETIAFETELLSRLSRPLVDIFLFVIGLGWAWSSRIRKAGANVILSFATLPLALILSLGIQYVVVWLFRILAASFMTLIGFLWGTLAYVLVLFLVLFLSLVIVYGRYGRDFA